MEEIIRGGRFEHYILTRSECEVRHRRWECGGFSIDAARYGFAARACGTFSGGKICVGYISHDGEPTRINGFDCGMDSVQIYPPGCDIDYRASPGAGWVAIECDMQSFQRVAMQRLGRCLELDRYGAMNLPVARPLRRELERMVEASFRHSELSRSLIDPILGWVVDLLFELESGRVVDMARRWKHRNELLGRADTYLRSHIGEPFDSRSLASFVGVTERALQKHFQETFGMSPGRWSCCLSLHHARRRLLECDPRRYTVESVAREAGFRHMGRFAGTYHELFGEFPSETLARKR